MTILQATLPNLPLYRRDKARDTYSVADGVVLQPRSGLFDYCYYTRYVDEAYRRLGLRPR